MSAAARVGRWLDELVTRTGSLRAVAWLRMLMGIVVVRHLWPDLTATTLPVERFHVRWWAWLPEPSPSTYRVLLWIGVIAGAAMALGWAARIANVVALAVVSYLLFVDMTGFAHNRGFLVWILFGLALSPRGPIVGLWPRASRPGNETGVLWPMMMLRVIVSSVYLTSGLTKLANPDWRDGLVLWDRMVRLEHLIPFDGWIHDVLISRWFYELLSPTAIATELFIGVGLWLPRTRLAAIWIALVFHGSIEIVASVQTFSYSAIAALLLWVTPSTRDRELLAAPRRMRRVVQHLDWLHRFAPVAQDPVEADTTLLVDRDGTLRWGRDAELTVLSRLPLLFPVVAPALGLHRLQHRPRDSTSSPAESTGNLK